MPDDPPRADGSQGSGADPCNAYPGAALETSKTERRGGPRPNCGGPQPGSGRPRKTAAPIIPVRTWTTGRRWVVYLTERRMEAAAAADLAQLGFTVYAPQIVDWVQDRITREWHSVTKPRLPGYGFCEIGPMDPLRTIYDADGVRGMMLLDGRRPAPVPLAQIERLMADDERQHKQRPDLLSELSAGSAVRIVDGALAGHPATVREDNGASSLVDVSLFGGVVPLRIRRAWIVAA